MLQCAEGLMLVCDIDKFKVDMELMVATGSEHTNVRAMIINMKWVNNSK